MPVAQAADAAPSKPLRVIFIIVSFPKRPCTQRLDASYRQTASFSKVAGDVGVCAAGMAALPAAAIECSQRNHFARSGKPL
jgi:hypothetical protein